MSVGAFIEGLELGFGTRLPLVLQSEAAECGLACLAMISAHHGHSESLADLRRRFGMSLRGATLKDLVRIASAMKMTARPLRLEMEELGQLQVPCILHWDLNHFVVLKAVSPETITIHDPAVGVRRLTLREASKLFTGVALELAASPGFTSAEPPPRLKMRALVGHIVGLTRSLGNVFALALGIELFAAIAPFFMQWIVDDAIVTADRSLLTTLALGFALLLVFQTALSAMRGWMLLALGSQLRVQSRANLFAHLVDLPASFFETRQLGDVLSRFGSQETILSAVTTDLVEAMLDGLLAAITLALMFVFAPGLALLVVMGTALYGLLRWVSYAPLRHASAEEIAWAARRDTHFLETLRGIKTIKLFGAEDERRTQWLHLLVQTVNRQLTGQKLALLFRIANGLLGGGLSILVVWLGAGRVLDKTFSVGMLLAFVAYKEQFTGRVSALIDKALGFQMLRIHAERLADIALTKPDERDRTTKIDPAVDAEKGPATIELRGVRFRYSENDPWILDGLDVRFEAGESVAIVGGSGCGKTTLLKMVASLLKPTEGEIAIDSHPIASVGMERYRAGLGVVMQEDQLFAGSIADNISFFAEHPNTEKIEACAAMAAVHDDIIAMPMGYASLIGDMGTTLSGGQKQRVLIARALYRDPRVLLLDEATSHLDLARERAVNLAVQSKKMTRILVAHRPETIASADRVIVLDRGKVVADLRGTQIGLALQQAGDASRDPARFQPPHAPLPARAGGPDEASSSDGGRGKSTDREPGKEGSRDGKPRKARKKERKRHDFG